MRVRVAVVVGAMSMTLLSFAAPVVGGQTMPDSSAHEPACAVDYKVDAAVAPAGLDAFLQRTDAWSGQMARIYDEHAFDTYLQALRLARTMAKADSRFVDWMDANPASACYQAVQSKMRTRIVDHAAILRGYARLVLDRRFDEAHEAWRLGATHYANTFRWLNRTDACGRSIRFS